MVFFGPSELLHMNCTNFKQIEAFKFIDDVLNQVVVLAISMKLYMLGDI